MPSERFVDDRPLSLFDLVKEASAYQAWFWAPKGQWQAVAGGETAREARWNAARMGYDVDSVVIMPCGQQPRRTNDE